MIPAPIKLALRSLHVRLSNLVLRGVLRLLSATGGLQSLQVSGRRGQLFSDVERFGEFGLWSIPPADGQAEAVLVFPGGQLDHPVAVSLEHRPTAKPSIPAGGVALYCSSSGTTIKLLPNGSIELAAAGGVTVNGDLTVNGELTVTGNATIGGTSFAALVQAYNLHTHVSASPGNPTSTPTPTV